MLRLILTAILMSVVSGCSYYSLSRGAGCFAAGTLVKTPQGWAAIESLKPNDEVISFDEKTGAFTVGVVEILTEQPAVDILYVQIEGGEEIQVTSDHPVLSADGKWRPIGELKAGDLLTTLGEGQEADKREIASVRSARFRDTVYNVKVRRYENAVVEGLVARFY